MATINGTAGDDTLVGTSGNDTINGRGGDDSISGLGGDDLLVGGAGNDTLDGGTGADTLKGGLGDDTYIVDDWVGDRTADSGGIDTVIAVNTSWRLGSGFENLVLRASTWDVQGSGNELDNVIRNEGTYTGLTYLDGADGNDTLVGGTFGDWFTFSSSAGNYGHDSVDGGAGVDSLDLRSLGAVVVDFRAGTVLGGGPDSSVRFANIERVLGSFSDDRLVADDAGRILIGSGGNDTLIGGAGADELWGDGGWGHPDTIEGDDRISGGAGNDTIFGGHGNDTLDGGDGDDFFGLEGYGNDVIDGGSGTDSVRLAAASPIVVNLTRGSLSGGGLDGSGSASLASIENFRTYSVLGGVSLDDRIIGSAAANLLEGGDGNDTIQGRGGSDTLRGMTGDDVLEGGAGADRLLGGAGRDWLQGGKGADTLAGGGGPDRFVFAESPGAANADRITDFTPGSDRLLFDDDAFALGAPGAWSAGDGRFYAAAGARSGHDADDRLIYDTSTGRLYYDPDGEGGAAGKIVATLDGAPALGASDITVI